MKNKLIKVLSLVMALTMLVGVFGAITISAAHTHTKGEQVGEPVAPTCNTLGYTNYKCAECSVVYKDDILPKLAEHTIVELPATEADCLNPAYTAGKACSVCGYEPEDSKREVVKDSTRLGHEWANIPVAATCEVGAYTYKMCNRCGKTGEELVKAAEKDGYNYDKYALPVDAEDAQKLAEKEYLTGEGYEAIGHAFVYEVLKAQDDSKCIPGEVKVTCENCDYSEIAKGVVDHNSDSWTTQYGNPCDKYVSWKECPKCEWIDEETAIPNPNYNAHIWNEGTMTAIETLNSKLQSLGYTTVSSLSKAPTCTEDGFQVIKCEDCKEYVKAVKPATEHTYVYGTRKADANDDEYCSGDVYVVITCSKCTFKSETLQTAAIKHTWATSGNPVKATCTTEGYTNYKCSNPLCDVDSNAINGYQAATKTDNHTAVVAHNFDNVITVYAYDEDDDSYLTAPAAGTTQCQNGIYKIKICKDCGFVEVVETVTEPTECKMSNIVLGPDAGLKHQVATCNEWAYDYYYCTVCGTKDATKYNYEYDPEDTDANNAKKLDPSNHAGVKAEYKLSELDSLDAFVSVYPTCTATGSADVKCVCGVIVDGLKIKALGHTDGLVYHNHEDGKDCTDKCVDYTAKAATCLAVGSKGDGKVCTVCGVTTKANTVLPVDTKLSGHQQAVNNYNAENGTSLAIQNKLTVPAKCFEDGYTKDYCPVCLKTFTGTTTAAPMRHAEESLWVKEDAFVAPTCEKAGSHKFSYCPTCEEVTRVYVDGCTFDGCTPESHVKNIINNVAKIEKLGHDWKDVKAVAETCTTPGTRAHKVCKTEGCGAFSYGGKTYNVGDEGYDTELVIPAHTPVPYVVTADEAFPATCTKNGLKEGSYACKICNKDDYTILAYHTWKYVTVNDTDDYDCTKPVYQVKYCTVVGCEAWEIVSYTPAAELGHNYTQQWLKHEVDENDCGAKYYEYRACSHTDCKSELIKEGSEKVNPHYYYELGEKVVISLACTEIAKFDGVKCADCGFEVIADDKKAAEAIEAGEDILAPVHNRGEVTHVDATCTTDGYHIDACLDCGKVFDNYTIPMFNHKVETPTGDMIDAVKTEIIKVDPADGVDGYHKFLCKLCNEEVTVVIPFGLQLEIVPAQNVAVHNGQLVLNVNLTSTGYEFNSIEFAIPMTQGLELVGYELKYAFDALDAVSVEVNTNEYYTTVRVYVANVVDGAKNVAVEGKDVTLVTLTYDVLPSAIPSEREPMAGINPDFSKRVNAKGELVTIDSLTPDDKADKFVITYAGDADGSMKLDTGDSIAILTAMYENTYNANIDFNKDGKVTMADHVAFAKYTTSLKTALDYCALLGIDVEAAVNDYSLRYDLNFDRAKDEFDYAILLDAVVKKLSRTNTFAGSLEDIIDAEAVSLSGIIR